MTETVFSFLYDFPNNPEYLYGMSKSERKKIALTGLNAVLNEKDVDVDVLPKSDPVWMVKILL